MPYSPEVLAELEKQNPDLVQRYRARMAESNQGVQDAEQMNEVAGYTNVLGKAAEDFANSRKQDVILYNRMGELGKAPTIREEQRYKYDPSSVNNAAANNYKTALANRDKEENDFFTEQKLRGIQKAEELDAAANDPTSKESRLAQMIAKRFAPDVDTEGMSANQLKSGIPSLAKLFEGEQTDKKITAAAKKEQDKDAKEEVKTNRDVTLKLADKYSGDATTKATAEVRAAAEKAENLAKNPSPTNDMSLLFAYMKANDPGSVVRESEFAAAARSGSLGDKVKGYAADIAEGQLTPEKRDYIMRSIREQVAAQEASQKRVDEYYSNLAKRYNADPDVIVGRKGSASSAGSSGGKPSWAK